MPAAQAERPMDFAAHWAFDPAVAQLNHGSFGACPRVVLALQAELRAQMERDAGDFLWTTLPVRLQAALGALGKFLGAAPEDLAFVTNASAGVNAILRSLEFEPGDELLVTSHTYAACHKAAEYVAQRTGARLVTVKVPFPLSDEQQVVDAILASVTPRTRLALLDHVTSPTALILPIARLVNELKSRGIETLVDGAHGPGMVPVNLTALGAAYYTGNAHKWLCAPKGSAFLHVRGDLQALIHPCVISHGYGQGFRAEFDWVGTSDPTPWLCIPKALEFMEQLLPGGWPAVMARNHTLVLEGRALVNARLSLPPAAPESMIGATAAIPLPPPAPGAPAARLQGDALGEWFRERGVRSMFPVAPLAAVRLSAQLYNHIDQYQQLAGLLSEALGA
jgi:isopenicillin-N epimerase